MDVFIFFYQQRTIDTECQECKRTPLIPRHERSWLFSRTDLAVSLDGVQVYLAICRQGSIQTVVEYFLMF